MLSAALATAKGQPTTEEQGSFNQNLNEDSTNFDGGRMNRNLDNSGRLGEREPFNRQGGRFDDMRGPHGRFNDGPVGRFDDGQGRFGNNGGRFDSSRDLFNNQDQDRFGGPGNQFDRQVGFGNRFGGPGGSNDFDKPDSRLNEMRGRFDDVHDMGRGGRFDDGGSRLDDMGRGGRFDDVGRGNRFDDMGRGGRFDDSGRGGRLDDMSRGGRFDDMGRGGRFDDIRSGGRFDDMQGDRFNNMRDRFSNEGNRLEDNRGSRFDSPGGRFDDLRGHGRFDDGRDNRFDDLRGGDNIRSQRNPFGNSLENRSGYENNPIDDDYFKPAKVIDYGNKPANRFSSNESFVPTKVIDHSNIAKVDTNQGDDYFPMKTIDYSQKNAPKVIFFYVNIS